MMRAFRGDCRLEVASACGQVNPQETWHANVQNKSEGARGAIRCALPTEQEETKSIFSRRQMLPTASESLHTETKSLRLLAGSIWLAWVVLHVKRACGSSGKQHIPRHCDICLFSHPHVSSNESLNFAEAALGKPSVGGTGVLTVRSTSELSTICPMSSGGSYWRIVATVCLRCSRAGR
eukprot:3127826-Amphidinium_carterae.1